MNMESLFNEWDMVDGRMAPDVMVARDAIIEGRPSAWTLLIGLPATIGIWSDRYAAKVVAATRCTVTVRTGTDGDGGRMTFRQTKRRGWASGSYRLSVGVAEDYRDPSF